MCVSAWRSVVSLRRLVPVADPRLSQFRSHLQTGAPVTPANEPSCPKPMLSKSEAMPQASLQRVSKATVSFPQTASSIASKAASFVPRATPSARRVRCFRSGVIWPADNGSLPSDGLPREMGTVFEEIGGMAFFGRPNRLGWARYKLAERVGRNSEAYCAGNTRMADYASLVRSTHRCRFALCRKRAMRQIASAGAVHHSIFICPPSMAIAAPVT
jgi:hypothetical protein